MKVLPPLLFSIRPAATAVTMACGLLLGGLSASLQADEPTYTCDFADLNVGPLDGQNGWTQFGGGKNPILPPLVFHSDTTPKGSVGQTQGDGKAVARAWKTADLGLKGASKLAFEFDVLSDGEGDGHAAVAMVGIGTLRGTGPSDWPAMAGVMFGVMSIREASFQGEIHNAFGADGKVFRPVIGEWYRVRTEWSYDVGSEGWIASLSVKNLSQKESAFVPLWFDKLQTIGSFPLGLKGKPEETAFKFVALRVGTPSGKVADIATYRLDP